MAAEMATIVGDVTGLQQRHHPLNIPPLLEKIKGFPLKAKSTYQKLRGEEFHQPPPSFVPRWGYAFACASEG